MEVWAAKPREWVLLDQVVTAAFLLHGLITLVCAILVIRELLKGTYITWIRFQCEIKSVTSGTGVQTAEAQNPD